MSNLLYDLYHDRVIQLTFQKDKIA